MFKRDNKGFTLIELLIVVAIIGIIAAIAIPNLLNAIQRGKQKRTMSDMRSIGTAVESYQVDNGVPPNVADGTVFAALTNYMSPTFIKLLPATDAWKANMVWLHATSGDEYSVVSYGKDRTAQAAILGANTLFMNDIYYSNGQFTAYPEGTQN